MTVIYHPGTEATVDVPEISVPIYRNSGWVVKVEWDEQQAQAAARRAEWEAAEQAAAQAKAQEPAAKARPAKADKE